VPLVAAGHLRRVGSRLGRICCFLGPLCGDVSARGIVALRRQLRGLAGAARSPQPPPLSRGPSPCRDVRRVMRVVRVTARHLEPGLPPALRRAVGAGADRRYIHAAPKRKAFQEYWGSRRVSLISRPNANFANSGRFYPEEAAHLARPSRRMLRDEAILRDLSLRDVRPNEL
jgi:hypothetical protein